MCCGGRPFDLSALVVAKVARGFGSAGSSGLYQNTEILTSGGLEPPTRGHSKKSWDSLGRVAPAC